MTAQTTNLSTMCPECGTEDAWHGIAGKQGVYGCDECGHDLDFGCPDWCERTCHHVDELQPGERAVHYGPTFGSIATRGYATADLHAVLYADGQEFTLLDLISHGDDTLAAARWMEASA